MGKSFPDEQCAGLPEQQKGLLEPAKPRVSRGLKGCQHQKGQSIGHCAGPNYAAISRICGTTNIDQDRLWTAK